MVGEHTRLITCLARWNGQDATKVGAGGAGGRASASTASPRRATNDGLVPLDKILSRQVSELTGDDRNIAVLARAYHGASIDAVWNDKDGFSASGQMSFVADFFPIIL